MSYEFVSVSCFLIKISRRSHAEIACEQALPGTSGGGGGKSGKIAAESLRAGYVEKAKKCAKACVASHAEVRHAFLPHEGGKDCVTRQKSA